MPEQSPADLIRTYLSNEERRREIKQEQLNLEEAQFTILKTLRGQLPVAMERKFLDEMTGQIIGVEVGREWVVIRAIDLPSLDSIDQDAETPDSVDASDLYLGSLPSDDHVPDTSLSDSFDIPGPEPVAVEDVAF